MFLPQFSNFGLNFYFSGLKILTNSIKLVVYGTNCYTIACTQIYLFSFFFFYFILLNLN